MQIEKTLFYRAAIILRRYDMSAQELAENLLCSKKYAATLRSLFRTCDGNPEAMRRKRKLATRESNRRAKERNLQQAGVTIFQIAAE